jgi:ankyrin repeat protein
MDFAAMENGDMQMLRMRLDAVPDLARVKDLNGNSLLLASIYLGNQEAIDLLLASVDSLFAEEAAALGRTDHLVELFDAGEAKPDDLSPDGFGLLHLACMYGHRETVEMLLDRGADREMVSRHKMKVRPIHSAAAGRKHDIVRLLIERGADVNATQAAGWRLIHHAAQQGNRAFVDLLIANGAEVDVRNDRGQSPVDIARGLRHEELADYLQSLR